MSTSDQTLSQRQVEDYLQRIGAERPAEPTAGALADLHLAHLLTVPFENLDIGLGRPIRLDARSLVEKVVGARRGGYCYELNGLFALLLRELGYAVDLVSARVVTSDGGLTDEFDHCALVVSSPLLPEPLVADVGFGDGFVEPVPLRDGVEQRDRGQVVGVVRRDGLWVQRDRPADGPWRERFVFTGTPHPLGDFAARNVWQQTSPDSHFTRSRLASVLTPTGRVTLSGNRLITTTPEGRHETELSSEEEVRVALRDHFGLDPANG